MKQLISRIDDRLHRRLKARAAAEGRSLNALVNDLLAAGVRTDDQRTRVRERLRSLGLLVEPRGSARRAPTREELARLGRGAGTAVSEALERDRSRR